MADPMNPAPTGDVNGTRVRAIITTDTTSDGVAPPPAALVPASGTPAPFSASAACAVTPFPRVVPPTVAVPEDLDVPGAAPAPVTPLPNALPVETAGTPLPSPPPAAPHVLASHPAPPSLLPQPLALRIEEGVEAAATGDYGTDPIFAPAASRVSSAQNSLQRRDGLVAEAAVIAGLDLSPRVRVLESSKARTIEVSRAADEVASNIASRPAR